MCVLNQHMRLSLKTNIQFELEREKERDGQKFVRNHLHLMMMHQPTYLARSHFTCSFMRWMARWRQNMIILWNVGSTFVSIHQSRHNSSIIVIRTLSISIHLQFVPNIINLWLMFQFPSRYTPTRTYSLDHQSNDYHKCVNPFAFFSSCSSFLLNCYLTFFPMMTWPINNLKWKSIFGPNGYPLM